MFLSATVLILLGLAVGLLGYRLFRILLPPVGFVVGMMVGFSGVQAVAGTGTVSTALAIVVSLLVGVLLAVLSYLFFDLAIAVFAAVIGASVLSFLGVSLGLNEQGFLIFVLSLAGAIIGFIAASGAGVRSSLVIIVTSMLGVAMAMAGIMILVGEVTLSQLLDVGIVQTIVSVVDQSFLWLIVWIGTSVIAINFQKRVLMSDYLGSEYQYIEPKAPKK